VGGVLALHSSKVLAELDPWEVRAIANCCLGINDIFLAYVCLRCNMKLIAVNEDDGITRNGLGICHDSAAVPFFKIFPIKALFLGMLLRFIMVQQHLLCQNIDQMINPPILLPIKLVGFQYVMISKYD